ncbi:hypothetical protein, partial [Streptomyces diastaticus]|uniref:hypothetical protein n=2 Tax=Streptomyces diastaticus TaxID=1956 RepID=UPI0036B6C5E2
VGCGSAEKDVAAPASSSSAPASPTADPDAAAKRSVLRAYKEMTTAEARTYATAKLDPQLEEFAGHKALSDISATLFYHQQQKTVMRGTVKRDPEVIKIDLDAAPPSATVEDCADSSKYDEVDAETGKVRELSSSGPRRHLVTAEAVRDKAGTWVFMTYTIKRGQSC